MKKLIITALVAFAATLGVARADVSVAWTAPPDSTVYPTGTSVTPIGQASASGAVGGTGLDLALVIDTSGSMAGGGIIAARNAAIALINALPEASTSVAIIEFDSVANTVKVLSALSTDKAALITAVNGLAAGGGTVIGAGIAAATAELTGVRHTAGRAQQMVVLSDGVSSSGPGGLTPAQHADLAKAAGVDAIHSVGVPGHSVAQMKDIADGVNPADPSDDNGVYTSGSLDQLVGLFNGTSGNLVGIQKVEVTLPDGTTSVVPVDGLGNFAIPGNWLIEDGANVFVAKAYDTAGNTASATLTLYGNSPSPTGVPDAGSTFALLGLAFAGVWGARKRLDIRN